MGTWQMNLKIESQFDLLVPDQKLEKGLIKSPLNYIGGKYKLLSQILPKFPVEVDVFVDLFTGGANVAINAKAKSYQVNDNLTYLIDTFKAFYTKEWSEVLDHIENRICEFSLSQDNEDGYKRLRLLYNSDRNPIDLFVLIAYSFNHQIRFNSQHEFNNPFGRNRSSFNSKMKSNLEQFIKCMQRQKWEFFAVSFEIFDFSKLTQRDFVYCDPPYLITTGTYNDGKRGFTGWGVKQETQLLDLLDRLNDQGIRFALSNVFFHKGKYNDLLIEWTKSNPEYKVNHLNHNYANSNYQSKVKDKKASDEVLITNYKS